MQLSTAPLRLPLLRLVTAAALAAGAGCNSLDRPFAGYNPFRTGHDGRVFNVRTGDYEWPAGATPRPRSKAAPASRGGAATPGPTNDGRPYDMQKREFTDPNPAATGR